MIHQCLGIGFSHPPQKKIREFEFAGVKVILGFDPGFKENTLAFVDSELFRRYIGSYENPETRKISIFVNKNYRASVEKGGMSDDGKSLIELIKDVCSGIHGDQGYLQFEKTGNKPKHLIHDPAYDGLH